MDNGANQRHGWRQGCQRQFGDPVPTFLMPAAAKALTLNEEVQVMKNAFAERGVLMHEGLSSLPGFVVPEPEGLLHPLRHHRNRPYGH